MSLQFEEHKYGIEIWTDDDHVNPFHQVGGIERDRENRKFFVSGGDFVELSSDELRQIADKMDNY